MVIPFVAQSDVESLSRKATRIDARKELNLFEHLKGLERGLYIHTPWYPPSSSNTSLRTDLGQSSAHDTMPPHLTMKQPMRQAGRCRSWV
jgi:hypothetical protein